MDDTETRARLAHLVTLAGRDAAASTREGWLSLAAGVIGDRWFDEHFVVPPLRVSVGWPSKGATARRKRRIGECWSPDAASDGVAQIFVSPYLADGVAALETLVHEMVHAVVGLECKHGPVFRRAAARVGLEGPATATQAGPELRAWLADYVAAHPYPHAGLNPAGAPVKKQTTRMIKAVCVSSECANDGGGDPYLVRLSRAQLARGAPLCGACGEEMHAELPDEGDGGDGDGDGA
jgi:hypothetical protein